jgi:hypothetical protein
MSSTMSRTLTPKALNPLFWEILTTFRPHSEGFWFLGVKIWQITMSEICDDKIRILSNFFYYSFCHFLKNFLPLCVIFNGSLNDGRWHGMDTYLFNVESYVFGRTHQSYEDSLGCKCARCRANVAPHLLYASSSIFGVQFRCSNIPISQYLNLYLFLFSLP